MSSSACVLTTQYILAQVLNVQLPEQIPRMTHADAMEQYGSDKPDVRYDLRLSNVTEIVRDCNLRCCAFVCGAHNTHIGCPLTLHRCQDSCHHLRQSCTSKLLQACSLHQACVMVCDHTAVHTPPNHAITNAVPCAACTNMQRLHAYSESHSVMPVIQSPSCLFESCRALHVNLHKLQTFSLLKADVFVAGFFRRLCQQVVWSRCCVSPMAKLSQMRASRPKAMLQVSQLCTTAACIACVTEWGP